MKERPREWTKEPEVDFKDIIYEKKYFDEGGVARITFNNPAKRNALTQNAFPEMHLALDDANYDHSIGVVILTGAGDKAFCSGADMSFESSGEYRRYFTAPVLTQYYFRQMRKPVIAAVKGYAIGYGNHLAYFCDFTIAAENAIFGQTGPRVASPAHGYIVSYLTRVVGAKKAREIWMLCRQYNAQQALELGLVNSVVPLDKFDEEVDKWCREILANSPTCIQIVKESFDQDIDYLRGTWSVAMMQGAPDHFDSEETKEAHRAFFEKRKPDFSRFRGMGEGI
ncbi:MAG: hypothetical protein COS88_06180 [Chloroflexi bacterium CG07_land_8_20_14_0_80_51_10]|nr:MAG: hypothetical protein COS88_06180 [Chloroflexi bacterium CG07_land_8_20_14_0_80_51_10]